MNVLYKLVHLLDCDPDNNPIWHLDHGPDNFAPCNKSRSEGITFPLSITQLLSQVVFVYLSFLLSFPHLESHVFICCFVHLFYSFLNFELHVIMLFLQFII